VVYILYRYPTIDIHDMKAFVCVRRMQVSPRMTDHNKERGIQNWAPGRSCIKHARDLEWLKEQVNRIQTIEPYRSIVIATHHCPTTDPRATDPKHKSSAMNPGFVSDLSRQSCWASLAVKVWAFGHTHYSCAFRDDATDRLVVSNQKEYSGIASGGGKRKRVKTVVVEQRGIGGRLWRTCRDPSSRKKKWDNEVGPCTTTTTVEEMKDTKGLPEDHDRPKIRLLDQVTKRVKTLLQHAR
jgi:hypothetical protein